MENHNKNNFNYKQNGKLDEIYMKINGYLNPIHPNPGIIKNFYNNKENHFRILYESNNIKNNILYFDLREKIKNSIVIQLASALIQSANLKSVDIKADGILSNKFYNLCINLLNKTDIAKNINDNELLTIYLKQLIIIIRNSDSYYKKNNILSGKNLFFNKTQLYLKLLDSFWSKSKWNQLFPSMPDAANGLMKNKYVMINLILKKKNKFKIASISNEFSKTTGISKPNDLIFLSFLDFYFFTWLSYFGVIRYIEGIDNDPVEIELTEYGKIILKYLLMK